MKITRLTLFLKRKQKKMDKRTQAKRSYMEAHPLSELSGKPANDPHHCIVYDMKRYPELTCPENLVALTREEHKEAHAKGYEGKQFFWEMKCKEYGEDHMKEWYNNLPLVNKERFW